MYSPRCCFGVFFSERGFSVSFAHSYHPNTRAVGLDLFGPAARFFYWLLHFLKICDIIHTVYSIYGAVAKVTAPSQCIFTNISNTFCRRIQGFLPTELRLFTDGFTAFTDGFKAFCRWI